MAKPKFLVDLEKILNHLTKTTSIAGTEKFYVHQGNEFKQTTITELATYLGVSSSVAADIAAAITANNIVIADAEYVPLVLAANGTLDIPAGYTLEDIVIANSTSNAITGGLKIGTTSGGTEVVVAQAVAANALLKMTDAAIVLKVYSLTLVTTLYIQAVSAWNSASVTIYYKLKKL